MKSGPAIMTLTKFLKIILDNAMRTNDEGNMLEIELNPSLSTGRIILKLRNAPKLTAVYKKVRRVLKDYLMGKKPWNKTMVDSAKGLLIYEWTQKEKFISGFVSTLDASYLRNMDANYNRMFIKSLAKVKSEDLKSVAKGILTQFLHPDSVQTVIVCNQEKINHIRMDFAKLGFQIKVHRSFEDTAQ